MIVLLQVVSAGNVQVGKPCKSGPECKSTICENKKCKAKVLGYDGVCDAKNLVCGGNLQCREMGAQDKCKKKDGWQCDGEDYGNQCYSGNCKFYPNYQGWFCA